MKKILTVTLLIVIPFLFIECSKSNDDYNASLFQKVQGKWILTSITNNEGGETMIQNGYQLDLKSDNTFTSNELQGYSGGTYTTVKSPGENIKLTYKNASGSIVKYKYIHHAFDYSLYTQELSETPLSTESDFSQMQILTRVE